MEKTAHGLGWRLTLLSSSVCYEQWVASRRDNPSGSPALAPVMTIPTNRPSVCLYPHQAAHANSGLSCQALWHWLLPLALAQLPT